MIITIAGMKGGVGKTTTAIQIAGNLAERGKTCLIDGDPNQSALNWARRSNSLPFEVLGVHQAARAGRKYEHLIMDTKARPDLDELRDLVEGCDLLIIPTTPDSLALEGMKLTLHALEELGSAELQGVADHHSASAEPSRRRCERSPHGGRHSVI